VGNNRGKGTIAGRGLEARKRGEIMECGLACRMEVEKFRLSGKKGVKVLHCAA